MSDIEFIDGLIAKAPHPKAPEFVKAALSIKRADLIAWLQGRNEEWINADVKESKHGKWYCQFNAYKREEGRSAPRQDKAAPKQDDSAFADDEILF